MNKVNATRLVRFRQKENKLTGISNEQIAYTNKNRSEVNLIRNIFVYTNTKCTFHLSSSKKVCITYFSGKVVKSGRVGLPVCLSIIFLFDSVVWWIVQNQIFRHAICLGPKTAKKDFNSNISVHCQIRRQFDLSMLRRRVHFAFHKSNTSKLKKKCTKNRVNF